MSFRDSNQFKKIVFFFLYLTIHINGYSQGLDNFIDFFTLHPNKKAVLRDTSLYPSKLILAPVFYYKPETNFGLGIGAKYLFKLKNSGPETRTSNVPLSFTYTLNNQFIFFSGYSVFFNQEKWLLTGNFILQNFPRLFYGIGRDTPSMNEELYSYYQVLLEPIILKRLFHEYLFLGGGFRFNSINNVEVQENGILIDSDYPGARGSTSFGAQLALVFDSRDNILNAQTGSLVQITHGFYENQVIGTHHFQLTRVDIRKYIQPFKNQDVFAFQLKLHKSYDGTPLNELALFGSQEIMRGYYEGRYIDRNLIAGQIEYRHTFKRIKRLGAVAFMSVGDVAPNFSAFRIDNLRGSVGLGLRFLLDPRENLNLRFDYGVGQGTRNSYLNISEAF